MPALQEWIYKLEEGGGSRIVRFVLAVFVFTALAVFYDLRCFRNLASEESMDVAQLARNIAEGRGYTTDFIRPASLALLSAHHPDQHFRLERGLPDLAHPPAYPVLLAGWMK